MTVENENGATLNNLSTEQYDNLSDAEIAALEKEHGRDVVARELARRSASPQQTDTGPHDSHAGRRNRGSPEIARAIWDQQATTFFTAVQDNTIESSTASAIASFKEAGGTMESINRLARHIEENGSEQLMMGALLYAQSTMGLRELARIGARLART